MTDRPIIFSGPMVLALLEDRKTQTRRVLKPQPYAPHFAHFRDGSIEYTIGPDGKAIPLHVVLADDQRNPALDGGKRVPHALGDRLWVKEAWRFDVEWDECKPSQMHAGSAILFEADGTFRNAADGTTGEPGRLRNARFMPRRFSRTTLTVTDVRVQRLQDISEADVVAEGIEPYAGIDPDCSGYRDYSKQASGGFWLLPRHSYRSFWNSLHGPEAWNANPWVYALTFTVQHGNIDAMKGGAE
jgi:hypothetical protein